MDAPLVNDSVRLFNWLDRRDDPGLSGQIYSTHVQDQGHLRLPRQLASWSAVLAASRISSISSSGCDMPATWDAPVISAVRRDRARSAMKRCATTGMLRSSVA
jgi:hypothetical protein